jgi:hypothetical protein
MKVLRSALTIGVFCLAMVAQTKAALLVSSNSTWKYHKGRTDASSPDTAAWRNLNFDDLAWPSGPAPFYYGENLAGGTLLGDMQNNYTCVYLRQKFNVASVTNVEELTLTVACDDGFIAWINGQEVARYSVPEGDLAFNAVAFDSPTEPVPFISFQIAKPDKFLVAGVNVLAIQAFNRALDAYFDDLNRESPDLLRKNRLDLGQRADKNQEQRRGE